MNIVPFLFRHRLTFHLLAGFIIIAGVVSYVRLPREAFPNIDFGIVLVQTAYPGASAEQVERLITHPIEKELKEVNDLDEISSASTEGLSVIHLKINPDARDTNRVVNDIQRAVDRAENLPADLLEKPLVKEVQTKHQPLMEIALSGDLPQLELQRWAKRLEQRLLTIPEVAAVRMRGYEEPQFQVSIDPEKLVAHHLSLTEVADVLARHNVNVPGGTLLSVAGEQVIRTSGELFTVDDVRRVVVRANDQGQSLMVGDVADVAIAPRRQEMLYRVDGETAVIVQPLKTEHGDIFELKREIETAMAELHQGAPPDLSFSIINDLSYYVKRRLRVLTFNGLIGFILVIIPLFLFLSPRLALGALIGMPTAFLAALAAMHFFGLSINLLTLFGLIMVLGMLVDEDIVVAENIHRLLKAGKSYREAMIEGTREVAKAVIATVLTTITAFLPIFLMGGIMGKFLRYIPLVVIITLIASLIEALIILPVHLYDLSRNQKTFDGGGFRERLFGDRFMAGFSRWLTWLIDRRYRVAGCALAALIACVGLWYWRIDFTLFPKRGIEAFFIRGRAPVGTSLEAMTEQMKGLEKLSLSLPPSELDHALTEVGVVQGDPNDPLTKRGSHYAQITVFLTPESKRDRTAEEIMDGLRTQLPVVDGLEEVTLETVHRTPIVGRPVAIRVMSDDIEKLESAAKQVKEVLTTIEGVSDIGDDAGVGKRELRVVVDPVRVAEAGLTLDRVARAVRFAFEGGKATTIKQGDEDWDVVVKFPESLRFDPASLARVTIANPQGNLIPLAQVATFQDEESVEVIRHFDRRRTVTVAAQVDERRTSSSEVNRSAKHLLDQTLGGDPDLTMTYGGEMEDTQESLQTFFHAFGLALLLTYIIVVASVSDVIAPIVIMASILWGLMGVVIGFVLMGEQLSFLALMGVIGMTGIVVDVGILMVDFIHKKEEEGMAPIAAIIEGSRLRLRPILLTNATTILGILPASIGLGGSEPFIQPMALALNWGIGFGSLASLFLTPVLLAIVRDFIPRRKRSEP
ncbi:MAG: efflux RND transporter permease subunit [Deltaproteobacteria bacterium]|nr:efflux RND transporter permease subunit [Deltaproteobacteria bacterium]